MSKELEMPDDVKPASPARLPKLRLEEREDGLKWALCVISEVDGAKLLRKEYWLGKGGNGDDLAIDRAFLERIVGICNAYPDLRARVAALEAENAKLREALDKADEMVPWFRQGTIWVGGRADHAERVIAGLDQLSPTKYTQECVDTFRGWVNETHKRIGEYESSRAALAPKEPQ